MPASPRRALFAFGSVSFAYFAYAGLYATYAPLWFASLGFSTLAIGSLLSLQGATRIFSPYAWGWLADRAGVRAQVLRWAVALSLACSLGYLAPPSYGWVALVTLALFVSTAGVMPINEAALAHLVSRDGTLDAGRYGRVRLWGSIGFIIAVSGSGFALQALGMARFPLLVIGVLGLLMVAVLRLPSVRETAPAAGTVDGALAVLRRPVVGWFFAGVFFTVLAHTSLYAFLSLYLDGLGYGRGAVGLMWALGVAVEVVWFWFQGRWVHRLSLHGWLLLAAVVSALRFAATAAFGHLVVVLVLMQCTHAITFAAQHTACIALISRHFPGRLRGRGQALYSVLGYGVSGVIGGVAGGALSERFGLASVFWAASAAAVVAALCCWRSLVLDRDAHPRPRPRSDRRSRAARSAR